MIVCNKSFSLITPVQIKKKKMDLITKTRKAIKSRSLLTSKVATIREV